MRIRKRIRPAKMAVPKMKMLVGTASSSGITIKSKSKSGEKQEIGEGFWGLVLVEYDDS